MKIIYIKLIFLLAFVSVSLSKDVRFTARVSQNPITEGTQFQLTFELNSSGKNFTPPNLSKFNILGGPSQSSSTQIINGNYSQNISFTYVLSPKKKGDVVFAPATIEVDGKVVKSNRLRLKVVEPSAAEKERRKQAAQTAEQQQKQASQIIKDNLFVKAKVSKRKVYVGEQILATYKLYRNPQLDLRDIQIEKSPQLNGFWSQDLESKQNWKNENLNGVTFQAADIKKVVLYPQQTGRLKIDPYSFNSVVRLRTQGNNNRRRRSMFDDFFDRGGYKNFEYRLNSNVIPIEVKELPNPKPESFSGGVGSFTTEFWFDKTETVTGEPVTLKVKISGSGNLKLLEAPKIVFPPDFEIYDPKIVDNTLTDTRGTTGNIVYEYLLLPRNPGEFKINPIEYSYFNTKTESYERTQSEEFIIKVGKGKNAGSSTVISNVSKENVQYIGKDIRFIRESGEKLEKQGSVFFNSLFYYILLLLPFGIFPIFIVIWRKREEENKDTVLMRNRKATKVAKQRLNAAKVSLDEGKLDNFYEELAKALWGYSSDKLGIPQSELNKDTVREEMMGKYVNETDVNKLLETIDKCEFARFAPSSDDSEAKSIYDNSVSLISKFEEIIR